MKIVIAAMLLMLCLAGYAQENFQTFTSPEVLMHAPVETGKIYKLINGKSASFFIAKNKTDDVVDSVFVLPSSKQNIVLVRNMNDAHTVLMDWFNIKDSTQNFMPAFSKATAYLSKIGGGTIVFGAGTFFAKPYFTINANNITVKGAGKNLTYIKVADDAAAGLMVNSNYRDAGWLTGADDLMTYKDDGLPAGQNFIDLKIKSDEEKLKPGTIIFINGGANYYDPNYGEFNMVDHCTNDGRIYLKNPLSRSYSQAVSSWAATLTGNFKPPEENSVGIIYFNGTQPPAGTVISIGNDLYKVHASDATSAVVINIKNKGNSTAVIPAGTHLFKYRAIALTPSVVYNIAVSDMTVTGRRKVLTVSNTYKTSFTNMRFNWLPQPLNPGGIWLDGDDGRDFKMSSCEINCAYLFSSQFARSFADIYIDHTTFNQAALQFSEFNINANITNCTFNLSNNNLPGEIRGSVILLGNTCSLINFNHNTVNASNLNNVFNSGELQGYKALINSTDNINNNTIVCHNVDALFRCGYSGKLTVANNHISGTVNFLFGLQANNPSKYPIKNAVFTCIVKNNTFSGNIDGFAGAGTNVQYIGNIINRLGAANAQNEYNGWGNVWYTHMARDTDLVQFIFKNNTFKNWQLTSKSFSHYWAINSRADISNNHFINGSKDSVVTMRPPVEH